MKTPILYVELKTGYTDNGPAWIGRGLYSKTRTTIYFNGKAFIKGNGISANYIDIETKEQYWISGVKKNQKDRHRTGSGKIFVDKATLEDYLAEIGKQSLDSKRYELVDFDNSDIRKRISELENRKMLNSVGNSFKPFL